MQKHLDPDNILELEFEYIRETVAQTIEDRHQTLNFYVGLTTTVATVVVGLLSLAEGELSTTVILGIALICFLLTAVGWMFLAMMIRLRQSWHDSMLAMGQIKNFYSDHHEGLDAAFKWKVSTLPVPHKFWNIHFYATGLINFISSVSLATSVGLLMSTITDSTLVLILLGTLVFLVSFLLETYTYWISLKRNY